MKILHRDDSVTSSGVVRLQNCDIRLVEMDYRRGCTSITKSRNMSVTCLANALPLGEHLGLIWLKQNNQWLKKNSIWYSVTKISHVLPIQLDYQSLQYKTFWLAELGVIPTPRLDGTFSVIQLRIVGIVHSDTANHGLKLFELEKLTPTIGCFRVDRTDNPQLNYGK